MDGPGQQLCRLADGLIGSLEGGKPWAEGEDGQDAQPAFAGVLDVAAVEALVETFDGLAGDPEPGVGFAFEVLEGVAEGLEEGSDGVALEEVGVAEDLGVVGEVAAEAVVVDEEEVVLRERKLPVDFGLGGQFGGHAAPPRWGRGWQTEVCGDIQGMSLSFVRGQPTGTAETSWSAVTRTSGRHCLEAGPARGT